MKYPTLISGLACLISLGFGNTDVVGAIIFLFGLVFLIYAFGWFVATEAIDMKKSANEENPDPVWIRKIHRSIMGKRR